MRVLKYRKTTRRTRSTRRGTPINAERVKMHVSKGDTVRVMRGDDKGKEGKVLRVFPKTGRVRSRAINIVKKHRKARTAEEQSGIIEMPAPVHHSNVMLLDPKTGEPTRTKARIDDGRHEGARRRRRAASAIPRVALDRRTDTWRRRLERGLDMATKDKEPKATAAAEGAEQGQGRQRAGRAAKHAARGRRLPGAAAAPQALLRDDGARAARRSSSSSRTRTRSRRSRRSCSTAASARRSRTRRFSTRWSRSSAIITGQRPVRKKAKKSIANFGLREGQEIGAAVTLRGARMWEFLDRFISTSRSRASATSAASTRGRSTGAATTRSA